MYTSLKFLSLKTKYSIRNWITMLDHQMLLVNKKAASPI
jgi:hypothetical protein